MLLSHLLVESPYVVLQVFAICFVGSWQDGCQFSFPLSRNEVGADRYVS